MSAVGFAPLSSGDLEPELDQLREACKRLNFTIKAIKEANASLTKMNMGQARDRLNNAQWQAREAKKMLVEVGKAKKTKRSKFCPRCDQLNRRAPPNQVA